MNSIPSELLDNIISHLSASDIPSLRLVCRGFSFFGISILFKTIHVFLLSKSFDRLACISRHENFRHHVQRLVFYAPFWESWSASYEAYFKALLKSGGLKDYGIYPTLEKEFVGSTAKWRVDKEFVDRGFRAYQKFHKEQSLLRDNGEAFARLATAMTRFDKLEEVEVGYLSDCLGLGWEIDLDQYPGLLREVAVQTSLSAKLWYWECPPSDHLMTLIRAVSVSNTRLRKFSFNDPGPLYDESYTTMQRLDLDNQKVLARELAIFLGKLSRLEVLTLRYLCLLSGEWDEVFEGLRGTKTLKTLRLDNLGKMDRGRSVYPDRFVSQEVRYVNQVVLNYVLGKRETLTIPPPRQVDHVELVLDGMVDEDDGMPFVRYMQVFEEDSR
ncbi:MAG: hypothetical protein M1812_000930 [Candelaria pacifica]|nr:MAG: hypothetical protein M1812_000930 [Candelaria pacifica]